MILIFQYLANFNPSYIYISSYKNSELLDVIRLYKKAINDNNFSSSESEKLKKYAKEYYSSLMYSNPSIL